MKNWILMLLLCAVTITILGCKEEQAQRLSDAKVEAAYQEALVRSAPRPPQEIADDQVREFLGWKNHGFEEAGSIKYILRDGQRLGGGYHSYYVKDGIVYGELGATTEIVVDKDGIVNDDGGADGDDRKEKEQLKAVLDHLGKDYSYEKEGAIIFIVDQDYEDIGGGYHSYFLKNGIVYGKLGATTEVVIDKNGIVNVDGGVHKYKRLIISE